MSDGSAPPYPANWEADVVLADGGTARVRPIRRDDAAGIIAFHDRQSPESIYFRFFSPMPKLPAREVERMISVDYVDRMGFLAVLGDDVVGVARYERWPGRTDAEVAFSTDDAHHGRGLATVLLEYLAARAREVGIEAFTAEVLPSNRRMLSVLKQAGFEAKSTFADGVIEVRMGIEPTPEALAAVEERAQRSEARSVARLLEPRSIAVVGASREPGTVGHELLTNLFTHGFKGGVYAVHPTADEIAGVRVHRTVDSIEGPVDLALVAVPAEHVPAVVEDCARKGVAGMLVVAAGFEDDDAVRSVVGAARLHGMRLIGPSSMGAINTAPDVQAFATFVPVPIRPGRTALGSQSGTVGATIVARAAALGLGLSTFVSLGDKADVSGNDLLRYWEGDLHTRVVLLHLESFGNPRTFARVARRVARRKPILAVRSGREPSVDALLHQVGVLRVDTLDQLLDAARVLASQPLPAGPKVALIGNSGGAVRLAADACRGAGLVAARSVYLDHDAGPDEYGAALRQMIADDAVDAVLVLYAPAIRPSTAAVAHVVATVAAGSTKPVVASVVDPATSFGTVPNFTFPDVAAYALGPAVAYSAWLAEPEGDRPAFADLDLDDARALVATVMADAPGGRRLPAEGAARLLRDVGVLVVEQRLAWNADDAVGAADALGYPVALKATGLEGLGKSETGGVAVDVHDAREVRLAYRRMHEYLGDAMVPVVVQRMARSGLDVRVIARHDELVGAVACIGVGGAAARSDPEDPRALRTLPLTDLDAARVVSASWAGERLEGDDRAALEDLVLRVGRLLDEVPEVSAVDLNPLIVAGGEAWVTDLEVHVTPWQPDPLATVRRL